MERAGTTVTCSQRCLLSRAAQALTTMDHHAMGDTYRIITASEQPGQIKSSSFRILSLRTDNGVPR